MVEKKIVPINYTSRDFDGIKNDLVEYVKRYYPTTYKDFSEASFGSLMFDITAYIGDVLSFYLDYSVNESFSETAMEYNNIIKRSRPLGFKFRGNPSSFGTVSFYITIPANTVGTSPNTAYLPVLKKGSEFSTKSGIGFLLNNDIRFDNPNNEVRVATVDPTTGLPTSYVVKAYGDVVSGKIMQEIVSIGSFEKYRKVYLDSANISDIISVVDAEGNEYYEVEHLSQNTIYKSVENSSDDFASVPEILKTFIVPRRFVFEKDERRRSYLQFGASSDISSEEDYFIDPTNIVLDMHGKSYISDTSFDPYQLITSEKFGISPSNTSLLITYRENTQDIVNTAAGTLTKVTLPVFSFKDVKSLNNSDINSVKKSLQSFNEDPIVGDVTLPTIDELKQRIYSNYAAQNRAVTTNDYEALCYAMPDRFGNIKRAKIVKDLDSLKRNLNLYIVAEDEKGYLAEPTETLKKNLKIWLESKKMISDTIDILDAFIVNIGIEFTAIINRDVSKYEAFEDIMNILQDYFSRKQNIGENFSIIDVFKQIRKSKHVIDVGKVELVRKVGGNYSDFSYNIEENLSPDGRTLLSQGNVIFEVKYPKIDIKGALS
ncbi:hypothetical protein M0R19_04390 [Candidatus Pacearchaeota archaeon]|nr:hypothetical protein [Candidatus Pacearchaeota archaeon]